MNGFDYKDAINEISKDISKLEVLSDAECKKALKECGNVYKAKVAAYSGGSARFNGIGAGARVSVKKSKVGTGYFLVVKGSKQYAPLWHLANNGFVHAGVRKITKVEGNHFVDKAELSAESDVNSIIDSAISNVIGDGQ